MKWQIQMPHPIGRLAGEGVPGTLRFEFENSLLSRTRNEARSHAMERILAWFQGQVIDRPPIRFSARNAEYDAAKATDRHWPTLKDRWFDAECQPARGFVRRHWVAAASSFFFAAALAAQTGQRVAESSSGCSIATDAESARITAGILSRVVSLKDNNLTTTQLAIEGQECLAGPARELAFRISFAQPNQQPKVSQKYGVSYFKQDFTNIRFGDMAEGHESRTRSKEPRSKLRGIDIMSSRFKNKPKQASGYQTQWE